MPADAPAGKRIGRIKPSREGPEPVAERATPATRRAVRLALRRMRQELGLRVDVKGLEENDASPAVGSAAASVPGPMLGAEWLADLDGRRQTEPQAVIRELADHLHRVAASLLPRALGIWGSALWVLIELEAAAYVNTRALRLARAAGDEATVADLFQRRAHVMGDAGDHAWALALADQAAGIADRILDPVTGRIGDPATQGRAAVDQSRWLYCLDRPRESIAAAERALELLPDSLPDNRAAAYSYLSLGCLSLGELNRAQDHAEAAERLPVVPWHRGKLFWIRANISRKLGKRSETLQHLRRAAEVFRKLHYGDAVLCSVELVQELLEDGQSAEALQVCRAMFDLVRPLQANRIISGALAELLRVTLSRQGQGISFDLVRRVRGTIERERNRKSARARRAWRALAVGS